MNSALLLPAGAITELRRKVNDHDSARGPRCLRHPPLFSPLSRPDSWFIVSMWRAAGAFYRFVYRFNFTLCRIFLWRGTQGPDGRRFRFDEEQKRRMLAEDHRARANILKLAAIERVSLTRRFQRHWRRIALLQVDRLLYLSAGLQLNPDVPFCCKSGFLGFRWAKKLPRKKLFRGKLNVKVCFHARKQRQSRFTFSLENPWNGMSFWGSFSTRSYGSFLVYSLGWGNFEQITAV